MFLDNERICKFVECSLVKIENAKKTLSFTFLVIKKGCFCLNRDSTNKSYVNVSKEIRSLKYENAVGHILKHLTRPILNCYGCSRFAANMFAGVQS